MPHPKDCTSVDGTWYPSKLCRRKADGSGNELIPVAKSPAPVATPPAAITSPAEDPKIDSAKKKPVKVKKVSKKKKSN